MPKRIFFATISHFEEERECRTNNNLIVVADDEESAVNLVKEKYNYMYTETFTDCFGTIMPLYNDIKIEITDELDLSKDSVEEI